MSRQCGITITLETDNITPLDVLELLISHGWRPGYADFISVLPVQDNGEFNWQAFPRDAWPEVNSILKSKDQLHELLGIELTWQNTNIGGLFHVEYDRTSCILWTIWNAERPILPNTGWLTDHAWFLQRIVPAIQQLNINISSLETSDVF